VIGGDAVDLAKLLGEEVGAVQPLVGLLDAGELELLALGEVAGVLPEHEPGAFEPLSSAASCVWPLRPASFLTSRRTSSSASVAQLDEVKWVITDSCVRAAL
jgi:hypothetical protein